MSSACKNGVSALAAAVVLCLCAGLRADLQPLQPQSLDRTGVYELRRIDPNLDGSGLDIAVICRSITYIDGKPQNDYRPNIAHNCFQDAKLTFHDEGKLPPGISAHSTRICSILFGSDPKASAEGLGDFEYSGVIPRSKGQVYEFWHFLSNSVFNQSPPQTDLITLGIGTRFEDWWTRGIESMAEHYGLPVVASIGNGLDSDDPLLHPGASANAIGVGVVNSVDSNDLATTLANFALAYPETSSGGTTGDGRSKPDLVAPGNSLAADANEPNLYEPAGNWSSFSTPLVAGAAGLLIQKAKQNDRLALALSADGGNCVIKAILMNSATKLPYWHKGVLSPDDDHTAPLDHIQGAGMLNAVAAYEQLLAARHKPGDSPSTGWDNNVLDRTTAPLNIYRLHVQNPDQQQITVTLAWNRHYRKSYPFDAVEAKNANLRLELWAIDPNNADNAKRLDYSDSEKDNVEHIYAEADPNYTEYEIVVAFSDLDNVDSTAVRERYALAWDTSPVTEDSSDIRWHDLNADGQVDAEDFAVLLKNWTESIDSPQGYRFCDLNDDGIVDINDLKILANKADCRAEWYVQIEGDK